MVYIFVARQFSCNYGLNMTLENKGYIDSSDARMIALKSIVDKFGSFYNTVAYNDVKLPLMKNILVLFYFIFIIFIL